MSQIGDVVLAKRGEGDYFFGEVKEIRPTEGLRKQYLVCAIKPGADESNPECWVEEMSSYDALRRWGGPIPWIEEWIKSH